MWKDEVRERYWWHEMRGALDQLLYELAKAEDEEELGFYLLHFYQTTQSDYECFTKEEEKKMKRLLGFLMHQTQKHRKWLGEIIAELKKLGESHVQPT